MLIALKKLLKDRIANTANNEMYSFEGCALSGLLQNSMRILELGTSEVHDS